MVACEDGHRRHHAARRPGHRRLDNQRNDSLEWRRGGARARLESTTGAIVFTSGFTRNASVELETHSGPIDIQLPQRADIEIDAATITGAIDNQWTRARPVAGREGRGMTLSTSSGMGGGKIVIRSFKGTVQLRVK